MPCIFTGGKELVNSELCDGNVFLRDEGWIPNGVFVNLGRPNSSNVSPVCVAVEPRFKLTSPSDVCSSSGLCLSSVLPYAATMLPICITRSHNTCTGVSVWQDRAFPSRRTRHPLIKSLPCIHVPVYCYHQVLYQQCPIKFHFGRFWQLPLTFQTCWFHQLPPLSWKSCSYKSFCVTVLHTIRHRSI